MSTVAVPARRRGYWRRARPALDDAISESCAVGNGRVVGFVGHPAQRRARRSGCTVGHRSRAASTGGLVGSNSGTIVNSYAAGNVEGFAAGVGGLVGDNFGPVSNSYVAGQVTGQTGATGVGGLLGFGTGTVKDTNSFRLADNVTLNGSATAAPAGPGQYTIDQRPACIVHDVRQSESGYPIFQNLTKTLTVNAGSLSKQYDKTAYSGTPTLTMSCCSGSFVTATFPGFDQINAGVYTITPTVVVANDKVASYFAIAPVTLTITRAPLNLTPTAATKVYDGNVSSASAVNASGAVSGDTVLAAEEYNFKNVVDATTMSATLSLVGGVTAQNKVYDGTTLATLSGGSLSGVVSGDECRVTLNQAGVFADKNAANGINVTATQTLSGSAAANYKMAPSTGPLTADITRAALSLTPTAATKVYDGNVNSTNAVTASGKAASDTVVAAEEYNFKNVADATSMGVKSGYTIKDGHTAASAATADHRGRPRPDHGCGRR
ncbi:MAG: hypothetical protein WDW36_001163 [Sanguina aurantia]